jgi:hypothetical protein
MIPLMIITRIELIIHISPATLEFLEKPMTFAYSFIKSAGLIQGTLQVADPDGLLRYEQDGNRCLLMLHGAEHGSSSLGS